MLLNLKCIKCKHIFTDKKKFGESQKKITRPENSTPESYLWLLIEDAGKNIKCPECFSSVYVLGIEDISLGEIDVTSQRLVQLVKAAIDIVEKGQSENVSGEYMGYASEIITELLEKPGQLTYIEDPELVRKAEEAIDIIWNNVDEEELFNEFFWGKEVDGVHGEGLAQFITHDYINRAKKLRPSLLPVKPDDEISVYFQNAIECWLFGINSASLILCCSVIETLLTDALNKKDPSLTKKEDGTSLSLARLINNAAGEGALFDEETKRMAHHIRELRRLAVHHIGEYHGENDDEGKTFAAIMNTKKIIEKLLI